MARKTSKEAVRNSKIAEEDRSGVPGLKITPSFWWIPIVIAVITYVLGPSIVELIKRGQGTTTVLSTPSSTEAIANASVTPVQIIPVSGTPKFEVPTQIPFAFKSVGFDPVSPSASRQIKIFACTTGFGGVGVTLKIEVNTSPDGTDKGDWKVLKELGVPCFNQDDAPIWDTKDWKAGKYLVKFVAKGPDDPNWEHPIYTTTAYQIEKP